MIRAVRAAFAALLTVAAAVAVAPEPVSAASETAQARGSAAISPSLIEQINAIEHDKDARSADERKVDSQLVYAARADRGEPAVNGAPDLKSKVDRGADGRVLVDIRAAVTPDLEARIAELGGTVVSSVAAAGAVRARLPLQQVAALAAESAVAGVRPADEARTAGGGTGAADALEAITQSVGSVASQGDVTHRAAAARASFGVDGTGVKIGVLSDGIGGLAASQASGNLGAVTVLPGQAGTGSEGTAMLEVIHDSAPGAQLLFATAFTSSASFAQNIRDLRTAGADIIVDDVLYFAESPFQHGAIAQAVEDVTAAGALYFSSATNDGNLTDNTSGTWVGDFNDSGTAGLGLKSGTFHDFDPGPGVVVQNQFKTTSAVPATLFWADPLGAATNDYDLFLVNAAGTSIVGSSTNAQSGFQDPFEQIGLSAVSGQRLVVLKRTGEASRFLGLYTNRGEFETSGPTPAPAFATSGAVRGHAAVPAAFAVAATPAGTSFGSPGSPTGPFPGPHTASNQTELFSSDGPVRAFFNSNGTAITPGNFSSTGGALRQKPDITAADGISTSVPGFQPFFGTSASAPMAAAVAALLKDAVPAASAAQVRTALTSSAIDIEAAGVDRDTGAGIVMADAALTAIGAGPSAVLAVSSHSLAQVAGDGDAAVEPGETWDMNVSLANVGAAAATSVSATLTSTTPFATVTVPSAAYPNIPASGTAPSSTPFRFTVAANCPCGQVLGFGVTATFSGGSSPASLTDQVPTGAVTGTPVTFAYGGSPVAIPDPGLASATLAVPGGVGRIGAVVFRINGTACGTASTTGLQHTFVGDLVATLQSPAGTIVKLFDRPGGDLNGGDNFCNTVLSDAGGSSIQNVTPAGAPYTGTFQPAEALARFRGEDPTGVWTLRVSDLATQDVGTLRAFSIVVTPVVCDAPLPNQPPVANDDSASTGFNQPVDIDVRSNDTDPNGDVLSINSFSQGSAGGAVIQLGPGTVRYTPSSGFTGTDTFTYVIADGHGGFDSALVTVGVAPSFGVSAPLVVEGNSSTTPMVFQVTAPPIASTMDVTVAVTGGTATSSTDYTRFRSTRVRFLPSASPQTLPVTIFVRGDTLDEASETILLTATPPASSGFAPATGTGTILDDDPAPTISIANLLFTEGSSVSKAKSAVVKVTLSAVSGQPVTVQYTTANGTATQPGDYQAVTGTITFAPGVTTANILIPVVPDVLDELDETFTVDIFNPVNATLNIHPATVTIRDDD